MQLHEQSGASPPASVDGPHGRSDVTAALRSAGRLLARGAMLLALMPAPTLALLLLLTYTGLPNPPEFIFGLLHFALAGAGLFFTTRGISELRSARFAERAAGLPKAPFLHQVTPDDRMLLTLSVFTLAVEIAFAVYVVYLVDGFFDAIDAGFRG